MSAPKVRRQPARKVQSQPARGFHKQALGGPDNWVVHVKNGYKLVPCTGAAHENPHIDNCMSCLSGTWGWKLVPDTSE